MITKFFRMVFQLTALACLAGSSVGLATAAGPLPTIDAPVVFDGALPALLEPIKHNLCGRGMSGRCTKGRGACSRGTPEQCSTWTKWSAACSECASAFAACRQRVGHRSSASCDVCVAKHDACEAKLRK
jgi:hypothetical protein